MGRKPQDKQPPPLDVKNVKLTSEKFPTNGVPEVSDAERALFALCFGQLIDGILVEEDPCGQH